MSAYYLGWFDDDKKRHPLTKLKAAQERYLQKWGRPATHALVSPKDYLSEMAEDTGLEVEVAGHIAPNTFFVGEQEP